MAKKKSKGSTGLNRKNTENFIEKYQSKADVVLHESGLMYRVIDTSAQTNKTSPTADSYVKIHQRILLADGSVIADSYKANLPEELYVAEAIAGLQIGLLLMKVGERFEIVVPPDLAWGKKGNGGKIGPNAVLIFDVRLLAC
ncbi:peptidyl-prolyl cis-trans isomerase FkpA [Catenovulum agarivorans DS-2]|uniref:Peptidyl-prolyl cis-trans isomerase n=2 Tax=Catenovulum agarivorans TaxID=1172192 RepID=W7QGX1_9ALTE|nr:peptidyl-prolyl cis-trans isomerase FkpA [Catenovulum agarivorans DS-2]